GIDIYLAQKIGPGFAGFSIFQKGPDIVFSGYFCLRAAFAPAKSQEKRTRRAKKRRLDKDFTLHTLIIDRKKG
ncbi:MAG: hypothetical protein LBL28_03345, partial [Treponema sp.]|nr:hypothetical protein [Treponema sp.]